MNNGHHVANNIDLVWQKFLQDEHLAEQQRDQFKRYLELLCQWNEKFNLTAITQERSIIYDHFRDSLYLGHVLDMSAVKGLADVGTGAGFPGVALKIKYPQLRVYLLEVNSKKVSFLNMLIEQLGLSGIEVIDLDWRTFLRKTTYEIDLFVARASLQPEELVRVFSPRWSYAHAQLVYWASNMWILGDDEQEFFFKQELYKIDGKKRKLIFFKRR